MEECSYGGTQVNLGTTDDAYIAETRLFLQAIQLPLLVPVADSVYVDGTIASHMTTISLGSISSSDQLVIIGKQAKLEILPTLP